MGRLNKKLTKKIAKPSQNAGLSSAAAKGLVNIKESLKIATDSDVPTPAPTDNIVSFSKQIREAKGSEQDKTENLAKKNPKANSAGKIVKISKKEKMKVRKNLLVKKLSNLASDKKAAKEKREREKVVIVKDTRPLLENLEKIEEDIKKQDELKLKPKKKKMSKHTMKTKKQKEQFMKDIEFLKAACQDPEYVANPLKTVTTHIKNTISSSI